MKAYNQQTNSILNIESYYSGVTKETKKGDIVAQKKCVGHIEILQKDYNSDSYKYVTITRTDLFALIKQIEEIESETNLVKYQPDLTW